MSVNANYSGNIQRPVHVALVTGTKTSIYSASNSTMTASCWSLVNPTGSPVNCEVYWFDGSVDHLIWRKAVAANGTEVESNLPIRLREGEGIRVLGASTVTVTVILAQTVGVT